MPRLSASAVAILASLASAGPGAAPAAAQDCPHRVAWDGIGRDGRRAPVGV